ncbi:MAG: hypothetical protein KIT14_08620 [bacterium]|nr:hypothetical protein [bacterium]
MNEFEDAWTNAARHVEGALAGQLEPRQVQRLVGLLRATSSPGALSLAALGTRPAGAGEGDGSVFLRTLAEGAAQHPRVRAVGLDPERIEEILRAILVERTGIDRQGVDAELLGRLLSAGAERAGIPIRPEEVPRIVRLLTSGEFFGDLGETTAIVVDTVPKIPLALLRDVPDLWKLPRVLRLAVRRDLGLLLPAVPTLLGDLRDGRLDHPPGLLVHTMRALYAMTTLRTIAETISALIDPGNQSVRLAIVIYARANGIDIEERHLDLLRGTLLDTQDPDLGPVLAEAIALLRTRYGADDLERVLGQLAA